MSLAKFAIVANSQNDLGALFPSDDGKIFHGSGVGDPFGPRCFEGDIMGCGIMFPRDYEGETLYKDLAVQKDVVKLKDNWVS